MHFTSESLTSYIFHHVLAGRTQIKNFCCRFTLLLVSWLQAWGTLLGLDSLTHLQQPKKMQCAWNLIVYVQHVMHFHKQNESAFMKNEARRGAYLKKCIILIFESASISVLSSNACCMWCNHLSAARWVTGNGRCRPISAGWPETIKITILITVNPNSSLS